MRNVVSAKKSSKNETPIAIVILAAGQNPDGSTLGSKSLWEIYDANLINHQISTLQNKFGKTVDVWCVVGFEKEQMIKTLPNNVKIIENVNYKETLTNRSLCLFLRACHAKQLILLHGDVLFNAEAFQDIPSDRSVLIYDDKKRLSNDKPGLSYQDGVVKSLSYGLEKKWGQIAFFCEPELQTLRRVCFRSEAERVGTFEIIDRVIQKGGQFQLSQPDSMNIIEVNQFKNINQFIRKNA